jgi:hypothetical protein
VRGCGHVGAALVAARRPTDRPQAARPVFFSSDRFQNRCAEGTLECGGLTPPWDLGSGAMPLRTAFGPGCAKAASSRRTPRRFARFSWSALKRGRGRACPTRPSWGRQAVPLQASPPRPARPAPTITCNQSNPSGISRINPVAWAL